MAQIVRKLTMGDPSNRVGAALITDDKTAF